MSVIIRLQNLPLTASSTDVRGFFNGLSIPDGGVHIVGGRDGDAFIAFSTDEDARQAMDLSGKVLQDSPVQLFLSSRNEMIKIMERVRQITVGMTPTEAQLLPSPSSPSPDTTSTGDAQSHNSWPTNDSLDPASVLHNSNGMQWLGMGMPNYAAAAMNLNLAANMGFGNLKLPSGVNPQMGGMIPGTNIPNIFQNHPPALGLTQPPNPFIMPGLNMGSNPMQMTFPGMMPNLMNPNPAHAMQHMLGLQNQNIMNPNITAAGGIHSLPGPFNNVGIRGMGEGQGQNQWGNNMPNMLGPNNNNPLQQHQYQCQGFMPPGQQGPQGNHNLMTGSPFDNGHGPQPAQPYRPLFTQLPPNFVGQGGPSPQQQQQQQQLAMGRPGQVEGMHINTGGMWSRAGTGPPPNSDNGHQARERGGSGKDSAGLQDRGRQTGRMDSRPDRVGDGAQRKRTHSSVEKRVDPGSERGLRSRSRGRESGRCPSSGRETRRGRASKSRSRSRSRNHGERSERVGNSRRNSDKSMTIGESDKESQNSSGSEPDLIIVEHIVTQEFPCVKLSGIPKDASYRDLMNFVQADLKGGKDGLVRNSNDGTAYVWLEKTSDFDCVIRNNERKMCGATIRVEGIPVDKWELESKKAKRVSERQDRERERERWDRDREKDRDREPDRDPARPDLVARGSGRERELRGRSERDLTSKASCLMIRGLPPDFSGKDVAVTTLENVKKHAYSDIHVHIEPVDSTGRQLATAYVKFVSRLEARIALEILTKAQGPLFTGDIVDVEELYQMQDSEHATVMLRGVPPNMSKRDVFDVFSDIGLSPLKVRLLADAHGNRNGQVLCDFQEPAQARRATRKDQMVFGRSVISVSLVPRRGSPVGSMPQPSMRGGRGGLLGNVPAPGPSFVLNPRFHSPAQSENPFEQTFNAQPQQHSMMGGPRPYGAQLRGRGGGWRMGGGGRGVGPQPPGHRPSRFTHADSTIVLRKTAPAPVRCGASTGARLFCSGYAGAERSGFR